MHALVEKDSARSQQHNKDNCDYYQSESEEEPPEDHGDNREHHYAWSDGLDILRGLVYAPEEWNAFLDGMKKGEFTI